MKNRSGEKIKLTSIDELLGVVNEESAMEIEIDKIKPFAGHPFKVIDDEKMQDLVESIKEFGVLTPVLIRPYQNEGYEMISGHRRMHAALQAGLITVPAIVREMTDDEAVIAMVDANIQREELLPSEKAFAYKMKLAAMKRQAGRPSKNNSGQNDQKLNGVVSRDVLAEQVGESSKQIQRYIRLTELIPDLLELVDKKRLNFTIAVDISYIPQDVQKWIYEYICDNGFINPNQITALRKYLGQGTVTQSLMISILNSHIPVKAPARKVTLNEKKLTKHAKVLYGLLLDRMGMAVKNEWVDDGNRMYVIYPIQEIQKDMGVTRKKAIECLAELEKVGLIEKHFRGMGLPSIYYVKNFAVA